MDAVEVGERLLDAIAARDLDAVAACFTDDARFWVVTPRPQLREQNGPEEAAARYARWFGELEQFEVLEREAAPVADRVRIRYLVRGRDPESGWRLNDHTAYARVTDGRIQLLTLTCAGFRPVEPPR